MSDIASLPNPDGITPGEIDHPVTSRYRGRAVCLLLCCICLGLWGLNVALPEATYSPDWILGENGNQLFRADQLHSGKALYRDMDCQYGPLPIWLWYGFTLIAGNSIPANVLFQNLLTLGLVALLFWWTTRYASRRRTVSAIALALGVLTFVRTPYLHLIASPSANFEYLTFERLCLLGLMLLWRPPEGRSVKLAVGLMLLFLTWQSVKVGGAFIGLAAYGLMDVLWLMMQRRMELVRPWLRWWLFAIAGVALMESLRCTLFVLCFGTEQGWRSTWPLYVADEYQRTWLTLWANPRHFVTVILPILALIAPLLWLVVAGLRQRGQRAQLKPAELLLFQAAIGTLFYVIAAVPKFGYFGHEWHFFQYQWVLLPLALAILHRLPWLGLSLLLLVHAGPANRIIQELRHSPPLQELTRLDTPIGPIITPKDDARGLLLQQAMMEVRSSPKPRSLIMGTWGGGGWYVAGQEPHRPHNIFFSHAIIRRPADNAEFATLIASADLVLVSPRPPITPAGTSLDWVETVAGTDCARQLRENFAPFSSAQSGWILLRRKQKLE